MACLMSSVRRLVHAEWFVQLIGYAGTAFQDLILHADDVRALCADFAGHLLLYGAMAQPR